MPEEQAFQPILNYRKLCKRCFDNSKTPAAQHFQKICGNF